jgi:integrase
MIFPEHVEVSLSDLSDNTIKTYKSSIITLFKNIYDTERFSVKKLEDYEKISEYVHTLSAVYAKITLLAIIRLIKNKILIERYKELSRHYKKIDDDKRIKANSNAQEVENYIKWSDILELRETYKREDDTSLGYLILSLYTYIPPQRGQVFYNGYIFYNPDDNYVLNNNVIDLNRRVLIINEYKTKKTYGTNVLNLPVTLIGILKEWVESNGEGLLLKSKKGNQLKQPEFTQLLYKIFNKKISTDMIRKIYVSHIISSKTLTGAERKKLANDMGHSLSTQEFIYNKF